MEILKRRVFICTALFFLLISISNKNLFAGDEKLKHFGVSFLFGAASETFFHYKTTLKTSERIILGMLLGSLPGLTKELIDSTKKGNHFSGTDLAADVGGAFLGAVAGNVFNNIIQIKIGTAEDEKSASISLFYKF